MEKLFDLAAWREILIRVFSELGMTVAGFLPNLAGAVLILLVGWVVSRGLEAVASRGMRTMGMDEIAARFQVGELLERSKIGLTFSKLVARLVFWFVMMIFVLSSVNALGLSAVNATIDRLVAFIPQVVGAALIGLCGVLLGRFVAKLVSSAASAAGILSANRLGFFAQLVVISLVTVLAAEQLGIATSILVLPLTVALGAGGLGVGLAFALGSRRVISHVMAGHFLKQSLPRNVPIEIDGRRGLVERVGPVDTLLRNDEKSWTVPNSQLLDRVVIR